MIRMSDFVIAGPAFARNLFALAGYIEHVKRTSASSGLTGRRQLSPPDSISTQSRSGLAKSRIRAMAAKIDEGIFREWQYVGSRRFRHR